MLLDKIANFVIRNSFVRFVSFLLACFLCSYLGHLICYGYPNPSGNDFKSLLIIVSGCILIMLFVFLVPVFYYFLLERYFKLAKSLIQDVLIIDTSEYVEVFFFVSLIIVSFTLITFFSSINIKPSGLVITDLKLFLIDISIIIIVSIILTVKTGWLRLLAKSGYFKLHNLQVQTFVPLNLISQIDAQAKTIYKQDKHHKMALRDKVVVKIILKNNSVIKIVDSDLDQKLTKAGNKRRVKEINELLANQQLETMS